MLITRVVVFQEKEEVNQRIKDLKRILYRAKNVNV